MTISFDPNVLLSWYQAQAGVAAAAAASRGVASSATAQTAAQVPTAPWNDPSQATQASALITQALSGAAFVDEKAAKVDVTTADADYKRLFAINQGLLTLQALAGAASDPTTSQFALPGIQQAFQRGLTEISTYAESTKFDEFRLTSGTATASATSTAAFAKQSDTYTTAVLATGSSAAPVAAFQGSVQFTADVKKIGGSIVTVNFDLSEMGSTPRSMSTVAAYMNSKLQAAGLGIRVSTTSSQTAPETISIGGQTTTIADAQTQWAFQFSGLLDETVTFSAPTTAPGIYVAQSAGDPVAPAPAVAPSDGSTASTTPATVDDTEQQLLKLEGGGGADAASRPGETSYTTGEVFGETLPAGVGTVHATATGADGSVYLLADATGTVNGQTIKGAQDAVLLKYDSAGNLVYTRTLGAASSASGMSLAVSADGKVAIAGSVTGELDSGDSGADPTQSDSFVTLYDSQGQELWTQRQGSDLGDDTAKAVAFDASGDVYVAGQTQGSIGGRSAIGGVDGYLRAYDSNGVSLSTRQFGTTGDDGISGLVVDGTNVYVAGHDGGTATIRSFDASDPTQLTLTATRSLGSATIGGIGLDGSGNLLIGGSTSGGLSVANTTRTLSGGQDAFGARISEDLTSTATDAAAYFGGSGTEKVTAATVAGGQVWVTGTTTSTDLPGLAPVGKTDGFVAGLDVGAGAVTYSQRFTAKDSIDAPESIAVDANGGSALDKLGLPKGALTSDSSQLVTSATSARAGDEFQIKAGNNSPSTVTIEADDTLQTLMTKIQRAGLFSINVETGFSVEGSTLSLTPEDNRATFQLLPGPAGQDALQALGLQPGLIRNTVVDKTKGVLPADGGTQTYGLRLPSRLDLNSAADIASAQDALTNAITTVRAIYADLKQAATPQSQQPKVTGAVSAYTQSRIADYQAALDRLTGADGSGSSLASLFG
ncbi:MAG TPA: SBBP repeat-containing protein [Phenylobacterium sp.]|uniref:SBBP repeat-containing protein n=1 Tax=Phenylobacterium sp. TaxID=1871053 RepID=UPI002C6D7580|nr:SBBP repeat-containing protein [Phenylobacterium sp.]HSV04195.1 SBBP repeat-containing protein [Phenylobacterium sp.]